MFTIEKKIENVLKKPVMPYIIYAGIMAFFFLKFYYVFMDDKVLFAEHHELLLYNIYSSRVLINPPIWVMSYCPVWLWGIMTISILVFIFWAINKLVFDTHNIRQTYVLLLLIMTIPLNVMTDVGWIVTSMTYVWPLGAALYAFFTIKLYKADKKPSILGITGYTLLTLYAANKEELCVPMLFIFTVAVVWSVKEKRTYVVFWTQLSAVLVNLANHMLSPNNEARYTEMSAQSDNLFDKLEIGVTTTMQWLFMRFNFTFLVFAVMLLILVHIKYKKKTVRAVSFIPVLVWLVSAGYGMYLCDWVFDITAFNKESLGYGLSVSRGKYELPVSWVVLLVMLVVAFVVLWMLAACTDDKKQIFESYVLILGTACGRITVGFANHGWGEFGRTYLYMYYAFVVVLGMLVYTNTAEFPRTDKRVNAIIIPLVIFAFLGAMVNFATL